MTMTMFGDGISDGKSIEVITGYFCMDPNEPQPQKKVLWHPDTVIYLAAWAWQKDVWPITVFPELVPDGCWAWTGAEGFDLDP